MLKNKIVVGFVPLHRYPFDEKWAQELKKRFIDVIAREFPQIELIYPSESDTKLGLVTDDEDGYRVVELFRSRGVDAIFIATLTFGDELAGALVAEHFRRIPIMIVATKEPSILPGGFRRSDSFCGTLSLASALYRRKIPFIFGGILFPEDSEFKRQFDIFVRVASIVRSFIGARVGLIGPRPTRFETVTFNEAKMVEKFGQRVIHTTLLEVVEEARKLRDDDPIVTRIVEEMKRQVDVSGIPQDALYRQAKLEAVLRSIIEREKLSGLGFRCWTEIQRYYGISPCYILARLTESGIMSSCEVDIYGVLTMLIQYAASLYTTPPHFIDWTIRHPEKPNVFLAWHCGNAPPALMQPGCTLSYHSIMYRDVGVDRSYGTIEGVVRPGTVTISRLVEYDGEFKMFITRGRIVDVEPRVRGAWSWVEVNDLDKIYRTLIEEGFVHHASMIHGDYVEVIADACRLLGIKTVVV
ncbi:MAG: L-fucose/L-arabinose isomerase family protein [Ignisphaera sp.]|uniref:L-fucose isomerase C-terminal domain-containing protein n=1 Tax=Ignisphaera aggregans TaxID=334771 RepID=A0A7J3I7I8_9CREN